MTIRTLVLLPMLLTTCTRPAGAPPPKSIDRVAVLPPHNRTADPLLIAGTSLLEKYAVGGARVTVPDVLAAELRHQLARRGFVVATEDAVAEATGGRTPGSPEAAVEMARRGGIGGSVLYVEIDRWEADGGTHPAFVVVALRATLLDPASGAVQWQSHRAAAPVATPGSVTPGTAYALAAQKVAEELVTSREGPEGRRIAPPP
jgi:hypothetical protein